MAYFHGAYLQKDMERLQNKINKAKLEKLKKGVRRRREAVYRPVKTYKGRALTREELNEYMTNAKEFYAKKALDKAERRGDEFKLPKSYYDNILSKSKKKFGNNKTKKIRGRPTIYTLGKDPELLKNRRKRGPSGKILTNKRDLKSTLKLRNENYFRGGKTRKRKRKRRRKTRKRRNSKKRTTRKKRRK